MNKEIEYLLNEMKDKECYYVGTNGCLYQDLSKEEINLLLSYIEQLEEELKYSIGIVKHNQIVTKLSKEKKQLENNRDKAIDYLEKSKLNQLDTHCKYLHINFSTDEIKNIDELINILKGDGDDE